MSTLIVLKAYIHTYMYTYTIVLVFFRFLNVSIIVLEDMYRERIRKKTRRRRSSRKRYKCIVTQDYHKRIGDFC